MRGPKYIIGDEVDVNIYEEFFKMHPSITTGKVTGTQLTREGYLYLIEDRVWIKDVEILGYHELSEKVPPLFLVNKLREELGAG